MIETTATTTTTEPARLHCAGASAPACTRPITHVDDQGWVYCYHHGLQRKASGRRVRRVKPQERELLARTGRVRRY